MKKLLNFMAFAMFFLTGVMTYAYVYDIEPLSEAKHYQLERDAYNRTNDAAYNEFPSLEQWREGNAEREARMYEWASGVFQQIGEDAAYAFDWTKEVDCREPMSAEQWRAAYGD